MLLEGFRIDNDERDNVVSKGITVGHALSDIGRLDVDVLEFLRGDVFPLGKFEDVLCSVDDLDGTIWSNLADISGSEPSVGKAFGSLLLILVVARHDRGTPEADLTLGVGAIWVIVYIAHLRNVSQSNLDVLKRTSDDARQIVTFEDEARTG